MAYTYLTNFDSPNYTPAGEAQATWGRPRTIEKISIHWWDDPARNPSFEGVIATLCNPARQASAHFVATGTGRRVACLVDLPDASWATNNANPYTISIECDPRCRDEDYDVVAELVAELRKEYGDLPLIGHRDVVPTRCPGDWNLARLDQEARAKAPYAGKDFGTTKTPIVTPPPAKPVEVIKEVIKEVPVEVVKEVVVEKEVIKDNYIIDKDTKDNITEIKKIVMSIKMMLVNFVGYMKGKLGK